MDANPLSHFFLYFFFYFSAPFESNPAAGFYSSSKGRSFGMDESPEMALSPSISSIATSASEVSPTRFTELS